MNFRNAHLFSMFTGRNRCLKKSWAAHRVQPHARKGPNDPEAGLYDLPSPLLIFRYELWMKCLTNSSMKLGTKCMIQRIIKTWQKEQCASMLNWLAWEVPGMFLGIVLCLSHSCAGFYGFCSDVGYSIGTISFPYINLIKHNWRFVFPLTIFCFAWNR